MALFLAACLAWLRRAITPLILDDELDLPLEVASEICLETSLAISTSNSSLCNPPIPWYFSYKSEGRTPLKALASNGATRGKSPKGLRPQGHHHGQIRE